MVKVNLFLFTVVSSPSLLKKVQYFSKGVKYKLTYGDFE